MHHDTISRFFSSCFFLYALVRFFVTFMSKFNLSVIRGLVLNKLQDVMILELQFLFIISRFHLMHDMFIINCISIKNLLTSNSLLPFLFLLFYFVRDSCVIYIITIIRKIINDSCWMTYRFYQTDQNNQFATVHF